MNECSEEAVDEGFGVLENGLRLSVLEDVRTRAEQAQLLFDELMQAGALPLPDARFRNPDLLELVLEECRSRQVEEPGGARQLAALASHLSRMLLGEAEVRTAAFRAICLEANARRLGRDLSGAAQRIATAAHLIEFDLERALYCQTTALIRWEQGLLDDADALLVRAIQLYTAEEFESEIAACHALLGLLREEERKLGDPYPSLALAWTAHSPSVLPRLLVRVGFALAAIYGEQDHSELARETLSTTRNLFASLKCEEEVPYARWAEAKVLALVGERGAAREILESVGQELWGTGDSASSLLSEVDLLILLAEDGDLGAIVDALDDLPEFPKGANSSLITEFGLSLQNGLLNPRNAGHTVSSGLRRIFKIAGIPGSPPFPFGINA
jgi:hypothetical protein